MPIVLSWKKSYASDKETSLLLHHFLHQKSFAKNALSSFPAQYRRTVATNSLCMVEGHLVFPEKVATTANQICRIVVPISLRRIIFSLLYASPAARYMGSTRHYIEFEYDSFGLGCVLTSINGSRNVHMVG